MNPAQHQNQLRISGRPARVEQLAHGQIISGLGRTLARIPDNGKHGEAN